MGSGKSRKTGAGKKGTALNKRGVRKKFRARHIDQVRDLPCMLRTGKINQSADEITPASLHTHVGLGRCSERRR